MSSSSHTHLPGHPIRPQSTRHGCGQPSLRSPPPKSDHPPPALARGATHAETPHARITLLGHFVTELRAIHIPPSCLFVYATLAVPLILTSKPLLTTPVTAERQGGTRTRGTHSSTSSSREATASKARAMRCVASITLPPKTSPARPTRIPCLPLVLVGSADSHDINLAAVLGRYSVESNHPSVSALPGLTLPLQLLCAFFTLLWAALRSPSSRACRCKGKARGSSSRGVRGPTTR